MFARGVEPSGGFEPLEGFCFPDYISYIFLLACPLKLRVGANSPSL